MKKKQEILAALAVLDQFASTTELARQWHGQWQQLFRSVENRVEEVFKEEEKETKKKG
jgi:hypothetical protein